VDEVLAEGLGRPQAEAGGEGPDLGRPEQPVRPVGGRRGQRLCPQDGQGERPCWA
jgi:hypothetical protein